MNELIEKTCAGLRRMKNAPDLLLYVGEENTLEVGKISNIKVVFSSLVLNTMTDADVPFIPLWFEDGDYVLDRSFFNKGYEESP